MLPGKSSQKNTDQIGSQLLYLAGDSDGFLHYTVATKKTVVSQGNFAAYSGTPVTHILTTGDPMKPLWKLAVCKHNSGGCEPEASPGNEQSKFSLMI